jgi:hypothetical protein
MLSSYCNHLQIWIRSLHNLILRTMELSLCMKTENTHNMLVYNYCQLGKTEKKKSYSPDWKLWLKNAAPVLLRLLRRRRGVSYLGQRPSNDQRLGWRARTRFLATVSSRDCIVLLVLFVYREALLVHHNVETQWKTEFSIHSALRRDVSICVLCPVFACTLFIILRALIKCCPICSWQLSEYLINAQTCSD